ncbi:TIGR03086 family metal-binding protein [Nocardioides ungokensis]|uniref:TIGR03086 family metal-binding protein n=1 Tax=Nocardioides ungokensis TaxID=1643322 RepID=UPI0015DF914C|nr:TIGR03086 family metal-binding protein [Nocardioides ungokensis]
MSPGLDEAVELLDRALAYTRVSLAAVDQASLDRPTPCAAWNLDQLLDHMADALDAFTEAAGGWVEVRRPAPAETRVGTLQDKACALLGAWTMAAPAAVLVGDLPVEASLLVAAAALEVTVHGWDVAQATGRRTPVPDELARELLPVARAVVSCSDRGVRFAAERPAADSSDAALLLAFLGRDLTGPPARNHANRHT